MSFFAPCLSGTSSSHPSSRTFWGMNPVPAASSKTFRTCPRKNDLRNGGRSQEAVPSCSRATSERPRSGAIAVEEDKVKDHFRDFLLCYVFVQKYARMFTNFRERRIWDVGEDISECGREIPFETIDGRMWSIQWGQPKCRVSHRRKPNSNLNGIQVKLSEATDTARYVR